MQFYNNIKYTNYFVQSRHDPQIAPTITLAKTVDNMWLYKQSLVGLENNLNCFTEKAIFPKNYLIVGNKRDEQ